MNTQSLEQFYEAVILPRYKGSLSIKSLTWIRHGKVGQDSWAHYFASDGKEFVLLYEDFPDGSFLKDGLSHEVVPADNENSLELRFSDENIQTPNLTGWFTLFREIS